MIVVVKSVPDYRWPIHGHDDDAEQWGPESYPEPGGEIVPPGSLAVRHQDLLEDEDGPGAAEDSERLPGQQAEHSPGKEVTHEGLQHTLRGKYFKIFQNITKYFKCYLQSSCDVS